MEMRCKNCCLCPNESWLVVTDVMDGEAVIANLNGDKVLLQFHNKTKIPSPRL